MADSWGIQKPHGLNPWLTITGVGVEKLLPSKSTKIKSPQEALQSIFSGRLDIFYPPNFGELIRRVSFSTATGDFTF
jgi:hypothetical protein